MGRNAATGLRSRQRIAQIFQAPKRKAKGQQLRAGFIPTLRTKLCSRFKFCSALAALVLGPQRFSALRAELRALGPRAACGAERHRLGLQVYTRGQVLLLELLLHLFHGGLYLRRRQFGFNVRRAIKAERTLGVPAGTANPMRALGTLPEVWLRLLGCLAEGLVMRRPLDRALNLI